MSSSVGKDLTYRSFYHVFFKSLHSDLDFYQPVTWEEYCTALVKESLKKSMIKLTGYCDITKVLEKCVIQSINHLVGWSINQSVKFAGYKVSSMLCKEFLLSI